MSVANSTSSKDNKKYWGYYSRYYINGNYVKAASSPENYDWKGVKYDSGLKTKNGKYYCPDPNHYYGSEVEYTTIDGTDCVCMNLDAPIEHGDVTTHSAQQAYDKVLQYAGASLMRDAVDARYVEEARTGTTTYNGTVTIAGNGATVTPLPGIIDLINDPAATEDSRLVSYPELVSESRPSNWDTDQDGIPDAWEDANGLDKNSAADAVLYTLDAKGWYTNLEVYLNNIVEDIVKGGNAEAITAVDEYFPELPSADALQTTKAQTSSIIKVEYFALDGTQLGTPQSGVSIRRITYSDGTTTTDKVIKK